jgi:Fe-S oxidoreductase
VGRTDAPGGETEVLLWVDTFNDHFHPQTARAAVRVLEHLGFRVVIPSRPLCCGRPLYDFGMLDRAKAYLEDTLRCLKPHVDAGTPMVVLEPSCCSVFRDELKELLPLRNEAKNLSAQTFTLGELLHQRVDPARIPKLRRKAVVQRHCHHHAIMRFDADHEVLKAAGLDVELLDSGCCGMAGGFGFVKETYPVSRACGERVLLPRIRAADASTLVVADGFSCKTQIAQGSERRALHLAEVLEMALDGADGSAATGAPFAESRHVEAEQRLVRASMRRAALAVAAVFLLAVLVLIVAVFALHLGGAHV